MLVIKRDGRTKEYDQIYIEKAVKKAFLECYHDEQKFNEKIGHLIVDINSRVMAREEEKINIEDIQDYVVEALNKVDEKVSKAYEEYREKRTRARDFNFADRIKNEIINTFSTENSNANIDENNHGGRELRALETLEKMMADMTLPEDLVELNNKTLLKQHDYAKTVLGMHNCALIDYPKLLANGIETRQADTKPCKSYMSACQMLAVIIQSQSLDMFGGCGLMNFSIYMVPYLKKSISKVTKDIIDLLDLDNDLNSIPEELQFKQVKTILGDKLFYDKFLPRIKKHVSQSNQALITNLVTLQSRSGHQLPFSSINLGLIDWDNEYESAFINQMLLEELDKGIGKHDRTAIFPILCFQVKGGVNRYKNDKYYSQRLLAQRISHHRLYPTIVNCDFSQNKATDWESEFNMMGK